MTAAAAAFCWNGGVCRCGVCQRGGCASAAAVPARRLRQRGGVCQRGGCASAAAVPMWAPQSKDGDEGYSSACPPERPLKVNYAFRGLHRSGVMGWGVWAAGAWWAGACGLLGRAA